MPLPHEGSRLLGSTTRSLHSGGHSQYREAIRDKIQEIASTIGSSDRATLIRRVKEMQKRIRQALRDGVPLDPDASHTAAQVQDAWERVLDGI